MPEVTVRKRKARRSRPRPSARRWVADNRPRLIVGVAFLIASLLALMTLHAVQGWLETRDATAASPGQ